jgi:hypothetical protein
VRARARVCVCVCVCRLSLVVPRQMHLLSITIVCTSALLVDTNIINKNIAME